MARVKITVTIVDCITYLLQMSTTSNVTNVQYGMSLKVDQIFAMAGLLSLRSVTLSHNLTVGL